MLQKTRRIPTILALLILLFGIGGGIFLAESSLQFVSRADTQSKPREVRVTNRTSSTATISWVTDKETLGAVRYGTHGDSLKKIALDDRSLSGGTDLFTTHHVTLRNLAAQAKYAFVLESNGKTYDNQGEPYSFSTFGPGKLSDIEPAYGKIFFPNNEPAAGSIVYLNLEGGEALSTLVRESGSWLIPINIAYDSNSGLPMESARNRKMELFIRSPTINVAQAVTDTDHDSPVPTIIIGKRYDFRLKANMAKVEPAVLGGRDAQPGKISFQIIQPEEQQALSSSRPLFRGKGFPGQKVSIIVESLPQRAVIVVDARGNWSWTPPRNLKPGQHKVTVIAIDQDGKQIELNRNFRIFASGSSVLGEATPSATFAPSPVVPTPTATAIPTPTLAPGAPSSTPTPVFALPTPIPTAGPDLETGNLTPTIIFIAIGSIMLWLGIRPMPN